jgi:predicted RNA binding protein YcfA (HicA-like mRNA interferase family)
MEAVEKVRWEGDRKKTAAALTHIVQKALGSIDVSAWLRHWNPNRLVLLCRSGHVGDLERVARKLGSVKARQRGGHARCKHPDGWATTIPIHSSTEVGARLFYEILSQLGIDEKEFRNLT